MGDNLSFLPDILFQLWVEQQVQYELFDFLLLVLLLQDPLIHHPLCPAAGSLESFSRQIYLALA